MSRKPILLLGDKEPFDPDAVPESATKVSMSFSDLRDAAGLWAAHHGYMSRDGQYNVSLSVHIRRPLRPPVPAQRSPGGPTVFEGCQAALTLVDRLIERYEQRKIRIPIEEVRDVQALLEDVRGVARPRIEALWPDEIHDDEVTATVTIWPRAADPADGPEATR